MKQFALICVIVEYIVNEIISVSYKKSYVLVRSETLGNLTPFSNLTDTELNKLISEKTVVCEHVTEDHEFFLKQINRLAENDDYWQF